MKNALTTMTALFSVSFLDGFLALGLSEDIYLLLGLGMIGTLVWMWVLVSKK